MELAGGGAVGASRLHLAAAKMVIILNRARLRDYLEIAALLQAGIDLRGALGAAGAVFAPEYNPPLSLKALTFFEEGDVVKLGSEERRRLIDAVRNVKPESLAKMRVRRRPMDLKRVAREVVWFKEPEETLADRDFFLAHVMTYGTVEDVVTARKHFSADEFRAALENAPAGVFDPRSWAYWNTVLGRTPVPPLPRRRLD